MLTSFSLRRCAVVRGGYGQGGVPQGRWGDSRAGAVLDDAQSEAHTPASQANTGWAHVPALACSPCAERQAGKERLLTPTPPCCKRVPSKRACSALISLQNGKLVKGTFDSDTWYLPSTDITTGATHTWEGQSKLAADLTAIVGAGNADDILDGAPSFVGCYSATVRLSGFWPSCRCCPPGEPQLPVVSLPCKSWLCAPTARV